MGALLSSCRKEGPRGAAGPREVDLEKATDLAAAGVPVGREKR